MKALSIRQPWAWLILAGPKDVENRTWRTRYRGPLAIHAARRLDEVYVPRFADLLAEIGLPEDYPRGGLVGMVELVDVVTASDSPWFCGPYGFVLANPRPLPFVTCRGLPGIFEVPDNVLPRGWAD